MIFIISTSYFVIIPKFVLKNKRKKVRRIKNQYYVLRFTRNLQSYKNNIPNDRDR